MKFTNDLNRFFFYLATMLLGLVIIPNILNAATVRITPGANIQNVINSNSSGSTYILAAGVHRATFTRVDQVHIAPKTGDIIEGEAGAVLSGAMLLTSFSRSGSYWYASGLSVHQGRPYGTGTEAGTRPEDLFINDNLLQRVMTLSEVGPGKWYFDYGANRVYFADDPTGKKVELSSLCYGIRSTADNVIVRNLIVEKYACPAQSGAIEMNTSNSGGLNLLVQNCEIRFNHGVGVKVYSNSKVIDNHIHHNGQLGIGALGSGVLIEGNEINHNNFAGYSTNWEAGGTKFVKSTNLIARGNFSHHNKGRGLWADIDNTGTLYENNVIEDNEDEGIMHEISWAAIIRNNQVRRNGYKNPRWGYGSGIFISSSANVEVYGNLLVNNARSITAVQQNRGSGTQGLHEVKNLKVHDNIVVIEDYKSPLQSNIWPKSQMYVGLFQDIGNTAYFTSKGNSFYNNTYNTSSSNIWNWQNGTRSWTTWKGYGQDVTGTIDSDPDTTAGGSPPDTTGGTTTPPSASVSISPGANIQSLINSKPAGTTYLLKAGFHRASFTSVDQVHIAPKDGDVFEAEAGAVLSGAMLLSSFSRSGSYWYASNLSVHQGIAYGTGTEAAVRPEDLFINDVVLQRVMTLSEVGPGKWYFDYGANRVYFADDPTGKRVELSSLRYAFRSTAKNVTIKNLTIEKYACPAQSGAIEMNTTNGGGINLIVESCNIRFNHGVGVKLFDGSKLKNSRIQRNGQLGISAIGADILVESNQIDYNNYAGFSSVWEAGGTKFVKTTDLIVRGNNSHHNKGPGLWTSTDNIHTLYENNVVEDNEGEGIFHVVSYDATIRNNQVRRNGYLNPRWGFGAGILILSSPNVEIYGNVVENNARSITLVMQNRGSGAYGLHEVKNVRVHDNRIVTEDYYSTLQGRTYPRAEMYVGLFQDVGNTAYFTSKGNAFYNNTYSSTTSSIWGWQNTMNSWSPWKNLRPGWGHRIDLPGQYRGASRRGGHED